MLHDDESPVQVTASLKITEARDLAAIKALFENAFPIRYNSQFYDGLQNGRYAGQELISFIARRGEDIIGVACASKESKECSNIVLSGFTIYAMTLAVVESERRKGVASLIMKELISWSASHDANCKALYLHVIDYNQSAIRFYEQLGFTYRSTEVNFYSLPNGVDHDAKVYVFYINGGQPPAQEEELDQLSPLEWMFDWVSTLFGRLFSGPVEKISPPATTEEDMV